MENTIAHITRNSYGEIVTVSARREWDGYASIITWPDGSTPAPSTYAAAWKLIATAEKNDPADADWKIGRAHV